MVLYRGKEMAIEIERKFLVNGESWKHGSVRKPYIQGYLSSGDGPTVRVRIAGDRGYLTIKGKTESISRREYEYEIPLGDAEELLQDLCRQPVIEKTRYLKEYNGFTWEIDEFHGANQGLVVAEIELEQEEQPFPRPDWLGREVSGITRYYNASLTHYPFADWTDTEKS